MTHIPSKSQVQVQGPLSPPRWATPFPDNTIRKKYLLPKGSWDSYKGFKIQVSMPVLFFRKLTPTVLGVILRRGPLQVSRKNISPECCIHFHWVPHWWHRALWDRENELHCGNLLTSLHGTDRPQITCHMFHSYSSGVEWRHQGYTATKEQSWFKCRIFFKQLCSDIIHLQF